jgi:hypothetical protein
VQNNDGISNWWYVIFTIFGIFGIINVIKAFRAPPVEAHEEYEAIIAEKDKIIKELELTNEIYRKIIDNDRNGSRKLE